jgi:hypothetical protein
VPDDGQPHVSAVRREPRADVVVEAGVGPLDRGGRRAAVRARSASGGGGDGDGDGERRAASGERPDDHLHSPRAISGLRAELRIDGSADHPH